MKKGGLKTIVSELQGASKMHLRQSKEIEKHIDDMGSPAKKTSQQTIVGENTGDIKQDKKGRDYALTLESSIASNKGDTIRPAGKKFPKAVVGKSLGIQGSSLMGGDYSVTKTGDKTSTINNYGSPTNRISDTTNAYIDRKLKKADRKMSKINSSNSDRKNERKLNKANKSIDQVNAKIEKRKSQDLRKNAQKSYGDNILTTPVTNSPMNFKGANSSNSSCWKGYKKVGTKKSPSGTGETVNDCKKI